MAVLWLALETPIDTAGDRELQSVHMLQHVLLGLVAPPLLALGLSATMAGLLARRVPILRAVGEPVPAQIFAACVMVAWHLPVLYDLTAAREGIHVLEHLSFIGSGVLLWWPVLGATGGTLRTWLSPGWRILYLLAATLPQDGVALVLQFSRHLFYPQYANAPRIMAGWDPVTDQNVAGAVLMVFGKAAFAVALLALGRRWLAPSAFAGREGIDPA